MSPVEAVCVLVFFLLPVLPPLIGEVCGRIHDALAGPNPSAVRFAEQAAVREERRSAAAAQEASARAARRSGTHAAA